MSLTAFMSTGQMAQDARGHPMPSPTQPVFTQRAGADTTLTATALHAKTTHVVVWGLAAGAATTAAIKVSAASSGGVTVPAGASLRIPVAGLSNIYTAAYASTADIQIMEERLE